MDQSVSATPVAYYPDLISELHADHKALLKIIEMTRKAIDGREFGQAQVLLQEFKSRLLEHVSQENLKLYVYLQSSLRDDPPAYQKMRELRKEMDSILIAMLAFFKDYEFVGEDVKAQGNLQADFKQVSANYLKRLLTEERYLFPLYKAHDLHAG